MLVALLAPTLPDGLKRRAAGTIASLAAGNGKILDRIVASGALEPLTCLLDAKFPDNVKEQAAFSLWNLSIGQLSRAQVVANAGAIPKLVPLLDASLPYGLKRRAAGTIVNIGGAGSFELRKQIVDSGAVPKLVRLLQQDTSPEILKQASWGIRNVCYDDSLRGSIRTAGALPLLTRLATSTDPHMAEAKEKAAAALLFLNPIPKHKELGFIYIS